MKIQKDPGFFDSIKKLLLDLATIANDREENGCLSVEEDISFFVEIFQQLSLKCMDYLSFVQRCENLIKRYKKND